MPRFLLFDFDGTIADSVQTNVEIWYRLAPEYGYENFQKVDLETIREHKIQDLIKTLGIPKYKLFLALRRGKSLFYDNIPTLKTFPGIKNALGQLKAGGSTLGIVTSNARANVEEFLKLNSISEFDFVHSEANLFGKAKTIRHVLALKKIPPAEAIYVGDEYRDIEAGHKAGIKTCAVTWGYNSKGLLQSASPDYIAESPAELLTLR